MHLAADIESPQMAISKLQSSAGQSPLELPTVIPSEMFPWPLPCCWQQTRGLT